MYRLILTLFISSLSLHLFSQQTLNIQRNIQSSSDIHQCGSKMHSMDTHPLLAQKRMQDEEEISRMNTSLNSRATFKIPVVFHIIYNNDSDNVSDEQIYAQLQELNYCFSASNHGINNVPGEFPVGDMDIEFFLATTDPDGNPATGITRKQTNLLHFSMEDEEMKFDSLGGVDAWDTGYYMNIWVCRIEEGVLGYGQFPYVYDTSPLTDGVAIQPSEITSRIFPNMTFGLYGMGRTLAHEVGHNLGLYHLWAGSAECTDTDYVDDTPNQADNYFQQVTHHPAESCGTNDMFMNHMCYATDDNKLAFTPGQAQRVNDVIYYYPHVFQKTIHGNNIYATAPPLASFEAPTSGCAPYSADFKFRTISESTSWSWSFPGGTPSSFTGQTPPSVSYNSPGTYTVSLTVSNSAGQHTETKEITVFNCSDYDCEPRNNMNGSSRTVYNYNSNGTFLTGHNGFEDSGIAEYFDNVPENSILYGAGFYFYEATGPGEVEFFIRADVNGFPGEVLYTDTKTIAELSSNINNQTGTLVDFGEAVEVPTSFFIGCRFIDYNDSQLVLWSSEIGATVPGTAWIQERNGAWGSFQQANGIDLSLSIDVNICTLDASVSNEDIAQENNISIFPNPTRDFIRIEGIQEGEYEIFDVNGRQVQTGIIQSEINVHQLTSGMYFIRLNNKNLSDVKTLIVN